MISRRLWALLSSVVARSFAPLGTLPPAPPRDHHADELTREPLDPPSAAPTFSRLSQRRLLALVGLAMAAVLVAAVTLTQEARLLGGKQATARASATATPRPTATVPPMPAIPPAGQGWVKTGPDYADTVVVAPSDPKTMYTCGQATATSSSPPMWLGISHDGGQTWQKHALPAGATTCYTLDVSPTNPQDVAFSGTDSPFATGGGACACSPEDFKYWVYQSSDGGAHWKQAVLPANASDATPVGGYLFAWAGATLFVAPTWSDHSFLPEDVHVLAASTNGAPLVWVDRFGPRGDLALNAAPYQLTAAGNTLYVTFHGAAGYPSPIAVTSDGGATWQNQPGQFEDLPLTVIAGAADGSALAQVSDSSGVAHPLLRTTYGGRTWTPLPTQPGGGSVFTNQVFALGDGTVIAQVDSSMQGIFELAPGAATWVLLAPGVADEGSAAFEAVAWDTGSHHGTLWAALHAPGSPGGGLFMHPA